MLRCGQETKKSLKLRNGWFFIARFFFFNFTCNQQTREQNGLDQGRNEVVIRPVNVTLLFFFPWQTRKLCALCTYNFFFFSPFYTYLRWKCECRSEIGIGIKKRSVRDFHHPVYYSAYIHFLVVINSVGIENSLAKMHVEINESINYKFFKNLKYFPP